MINQIPFTVLAIVEAKAGKEKSLLDTLLSLIPLTKQEGGCLTFTLYQCHDNPRKCMFYEDWEAQAVHRHSPHMKAWRTQKEELLITPSNVTSWKMIK